MSDAHDTGRPAVRGGDEARTSGGVLPPEPPGATPAAGALTYEDACGRLEAIIRRLDSGEAGLRETLELCREGRGLVERCAAELDAVGAGLEELRLDELVARLEGRRTP